MIKKIFFDFGSLLDVHDSLLIVQYQLSSSCKMECIDIISIFRENYYDSYEFKSQFLESAIKKLSDNDTLSLEINDSDYRYIANKISWIGTLNFSILNDFLTNVIDYKILLYDVNEWNIVECICKSSTSIFYFNWETSA